MCCTKIELIRYWSRKLNLVKMGSQVQTLRKSFVGRDCHRVPNKLTLIRKKRKILYNVKLEFKKEGKS